MKKMYKRLYLRIKKMKLWVEHVLIGKKHKRIGLGKKILALRYNFSSYFFDLYHLNRKNIKDYISEYSRYCSREIDGDYKFLLDNKIVFTDFFDKYVQVPQIAFYLNHGIATAGGGLANSKEFLKFLKNKKIILKPMDSGGGHGVYIVENKNNEYFWDYEKISVEDLLVKILSLNNYIVNEFVVQHKYSSNIYPKSVNTIRIITIKDPSTKECIIPIAVHRFGNAVTGSVDNASRGGYITKIDIKTGILGETKKLNDLTSIDTHPDTNSKIKGVKIPHWEYITNELIHVASRLPYLPFIAWDVVVTDKGFTILEANASSSLELFQIFGTLKNNKLWDFYKYYGIIKK